MRPQIDATLPFAEAANLWLESRTFQSTNIRARYIAPETLRNYRQYVKQLNELQFKELPLNDIHLGHIHNYQHVRVEMCSPNRVNQELLILQLVMKAADCWSDELEQCYEPLQRVESDIPKALTPIEMQRWLTVSGSRPEWRVVHLYSVVALRTSLSNVEMRSLRLGDVMGTVVTVQSLYAKNKYRIRTIPLTPDAQWAIDQLRVRAAGLGSFQPHHYLFPFHSGFETYTPEKPMTTWGIRKPWAEVRGAAMLPWFTPHDTRHTCITRWAEAGTPIPVIMSMAGHISQRMMMHYTHISEAAKQMAVVAAYDQSLYGKFSQQNQKDNYKGTCAAVAGVR